MGSVLESHRLRRASACFSRRDELSRASGIRSTSTLGIGRRRTLGSDSSRLAVIASWPGLVDASGAARAIRALFGSIGCNPDGHPRIKDCSHS